MGGRSSVPSDDNTGENRARRLLVVHLWSPRRTSSGEHFYDHKSIQRIVESSPGVVQMPHTYKRYFKEFGRRVNYTEHALHRALEVGLPRDTIMAIFNAYPHAAEATDSLGKTPLHHACEQQNREQPEVAIKFLIDKNPDALRIKDKFGRLPLHYACAQGEQNLSRELILKMLEEYKDGAKQVDRFGRTPLHKAVFGNNCSELIVRAVLLAAPESASVRITSSFVRGRIPLHGYADKSTDLDNFDLFLKAYPRSGFCFDDENSPDRVSPFSIVWAKYSRHGTPLWRVPSTMQLPLWKQMMLMVHYYTHADDKVGQTYYSPADKEVFHPLHAVARCHCLPNEFFALAIEAYAEEASKHDNQGRLPLNLAVERGCTWEDGVAVLLKKEPRAAWTRDIKTGMHPFMLAASCESADLTTIYSLLRWDPAKIFAGIKYKMQAKN